MIQKFIENGYKIVENHEKADIYIINTCTVTNMSDRKSRQMLRRVKELNSKSIVVACGCYAQVAKKELEKIKEIDLILGNNEKGEIVEHVEDYIKNQEKINIEDVMRQREFVDFGNVTYTEKTRAVIKVQDGCDRFCSYCIIPYARGRVRSRKPENVLAEIRKVAEEGIKEVVITGIHVASYGKDFDNENTSKKIRLIDLLEAINKIDGIDRIRLSSLEPTIVDEEFATRLSKLDKICDHFHLSLQSGCDETLKRMNRKYTTQIYRDAVATLRKYYPEASFTTDVIVGFPQETEEEFEATCAFARRIAFAQIHVFKYSRRQGTMADAMTGQVDETIKNQRSEKLIGIEKELEKEYQKYFIGKKEEVLLEEVQLIEGREYVVGYNERYVRIAVSCTEMPDAKERCNTIATVKIERHLTDEILLGVYQ